MTVIIKCEDLGINDCDYVASGEVAKDSLEDMLDHLDSEHDIDLPDADVILSGEPVVESNQAGETGKVVLIKRLRGVLEIPNNPDGNPPQPAIGKVTS